MDRAEKVSNQMVLPAAGMSAEWNRNSRFRCRPRQFNRRNAQRRASEIRLLGGVALAPDTEIFRQGYVCTIRAKVR
jgi:hypothetical protein